MSPMESIAVRCSWADAQILTDPKLSTTLPVNLRDSVLNSSGATYLDALASAALLSGCTDRIFTLYQPLITEIAARCLRGNSNQSLSDAINVLSCLARIFPFARYLRPCITTFLQTSQLRSLLYDAATPAATEDDSDGKTLLLAILRLLSTEPVTFRDAIKPTFLCSFLNHASRPVRYLAIQCLCIVMRFADALCESLIKQYVGDERVGGLWEGKDIDYHLLKLLEEKRWMQLNEDIRTIEYVRSDTTSGDVMRFSVADLSTHTANIGGVLVPRSSEVKVIGSSFVNTPTADKNLRGIGQALLRQKPILLTGAPSSGKTTLIIESARLLNKQNSMITLHLNEQTDAKSLLGVYTSSTTGEAFVWQPGVLTKAVQQGRWVVIEDIDRAPAEVLGLLRPIIEHGELFLPSRKERIRPAEGFRVFATIKASSKPDRTSHSRHAWLSSNRLWSVVQIDDYERDEVEALLKTRYPSIVVLSPMIMEVHETVHLAYRDEVAFRAVQSRLPSLRDLLKWCRRASRRFQLQKHDISQHLMSESIKFEIFKDAIDCYAAFHSDENVYQQIARRIAATMNISPQQMNHILKIGIADITDSVSRVKVGRSVLRKVETRRHAASKKATFAMTNLARRTMESVAAGVSYSEPSLLVGETGVGKTTIVQHIANLVNQKLTVVNLSQQSEATDLLGGLKPITTRSLIVPLLDQFNTLFDDTFSNKRNEKFRIAIAKAVAKQNWQRLVLLWQEASQMADNSLRKPFDTPSVDGDSQATKKRKLSSKHTALFERWTSFSSKLNQLRSHIERGDKNHTFAFVEGRLVQAVRGGEWLLLDEINLASADTLDHIVGLLRNGEDGNPSLLLTEAGEIEQIEAHPDFRMFAAMNPATDAGKKDLAPGLRSRFTEIYVQSGDNAIDDLVKIVETYLGAILGSDKRAALDLARAYTELKKLNEQHKLTDGAGDVPHFSIRSLVRCLLYVIQHTPSHGLRRSMHEGFAMSFFTVLSKDSEDLALPILNTHLLSNIKNQRSFMSQQLKIPFDADEYVAFRHHIVRRGTNSPDLQPHYIRTPSVERNLLNLARAASMRRFPILLQGPTSAGKTSMVEYLAKLSGNEFVRINNHEHTDLQEYLGSYATGTDGKLEFREGVLIQALRSGHWVVLDELNLAPSDVLEALNRLLDDNRELLIPESQEVVRPHPNFMLFATQNPAGLYGGRKRLSRAFRNRFLELHFDDIPEDELGVILQKRAQIAPSFCAQIVQVYKKLSLQRQSARLFEQRNSFATLRDLFRWAARPVDDRLQLAQHGFMLLGERVRDPAERKVVKMTIEETIKVKIDESVLYSPAVVPSSILSSTIVWTPAMRRLLVLVTAALKNKEPVLLVGETGCGKTQICQTVAQAFERHLSIYNAHSNTETGDLIGSQRPIRQRSELASAVLDNMAQLAAPGLAEFDLQVCPIDDLIADFKKMDTSGLDADAIERTRQSIGAYQSLFAWNDGSLVRAMKAGEHFLLDEISLADDSVLERLNSVLEPSRTILLAEKGANENYVVADSDFQFLATMNPGGDYGKRELSAALRNRLTEIWVPSLSQDDDILPILQTKLGPEFAHFASMMLEFATWFRDNMQSSATSTVSLRSLLTWTEFIKKNTSLIAEVVFVHGAAMVYIDSLGANPAGLTSSSSGDLTTIRQLCLKKLQAISQVDVFALYDEVPDFRLSESQLQLGTFTLQRTSHGKDISDLVFDAPTTLRNAMRIVRALQMYRPILLEGSPGVGKTAIVTALAEAVGKPLIRINLSDQTDLMDLFGADAPSEDEKLGNFSWRDGPLLQAMQSGGWVLLDEMNLASQSVLEGLNSCLDHRHEVYIAELDKSFTCHPEFTLFAAQNPHHQGGGRKGLPASFVNRFTVVYADSFKKEDLLRICKKKRPQVPDERLGAIIDTVSDGHILVTDSATFSSGGPWELNLRDINRWLDLCEAYPNLPPAYHFDTVLSQRFRGAKARNQIVSLCHQHFQEAVQASLYHNLSSNIFQLGTAILRRDDTMQHIESGHSISPSHLPYARSMITALNHAWPLVIVGPSGSGKTQLIHTLAALSGAKLVEFSMNADVDTMDMIGGFEQHDTRRDISDIQKEVCTVISKMICEAMPDIRNLNVSSLLFRLFEQCSAPDIDAQSLLAVVEDASSRIGLLVDFQERLQSIVRSQKSTTSRFVWNDGILIDALQDGSWLVLDNANLCNPSVLDRLNSLLEPNGTLIVSEQHNSGQSERIIRPHPKFRIFLTMDSKYGELSRAMRNRSLEIFIDGDDDAHPNLPFPVYSTTASVSRLRQLLTCTPASLKETTRYALQPYVSNLSFNDLRLSHAELPQIFDKDDHTADIDNEFSQFLMLSEDIRGDIAQLYGSLADQVTPLLPKGAVQDQPQFPIINDALLDLTNHDRAQATRLTRLVLLCGEKIQLETILGRVQNSSKSTKKDEMTIIEQSLVSSARQSKTKQQSVPPVYQFLTALVNLFSYEAGKNANLVVHQKIFKLVEDLVQFFSGRSFDHGRLQAYLQIVDDLAIEYATTENRLAIALRQTRALIGSQFRLQVGTGLQRMWSMWKPNTASNMEQLEALLSMESLVLEFDQLAMKLPQRRSALAHVRSRLSDTCATIMLEPEPKSIVSTLATAIRELASGGTRRIEQSGLFAPSFGWLMRHLLIENTFQSPIEMQTLALLAHDSAIDCPRAQDRSLHHGLKTFAFLNQGSDELIGSGKTSSSHVGFELIACANSVDSQPLSALDYLEEETQEMTRALSVHSTHIASDLLMPLKEATSNLARELLSSQVGLLNADMRSYFSSNFDLGLLAGLNASQIIISGSHEGAHLQEIYDGLLRPIMPLLTEKALVTTADVGKALINVSLAALRLIVPDKVFDPAVYPALTQQRHLSRVKELQAKIRSHKEYQQHFSGQDNDMLVRMYELDLADLGDVPPATTVMRPQKPELLHLQEEFTNVIRSVIQSDQVQQLGLATEDISKTYDAVSRSRRNFIQIISTHLRRLSRINRAYDDLVKPVSWLLEALSYGTKMLSSDISVASLGTRTKLLTGVPLLGASPTEIMLDYTLQLPGRSSATPTIFKQLNKLILQKQVESDLRQSDASTTSIFLGLVQPLYVEWKEYLSKDQVDAEAKARYYAYRGEDEFPQDDEDAELATLFPTFDTEEQDSKIPTDQYDAHATAVRVARVHEQLFIISKSQDAVRLNILLALETLDKQTSEHREIPSLEDMLPGILLQMEHSMNDLSSRESDKPFNIYADTDIAEVRKLLRVVNDVQTRFEVINQQWPEHAVPIEVLAFCDEVLAFKINEPIAKLLTKTEKLLEIVSQWQSVASREWSVTNLVEVLTALIIQWRRLELSSWSRLLDLEQKKTEEATSAWYFIAYEAVIVNSSIVAGQGNDAASYCRELTRTVEEFLATTTMGQFSNRLRLLLIFHKTLVALSTSDPKLVPIVESLSSVLFHYQRYEPQIQQNLNLGRTDLEKNIKEQIQLASWKDTSIASLRDSARRTHHKLFKVIKKYRAILSQPVMSFKATDTNEDSSSTIEADVELPATHHDQLQSALIACSRDIRAWASRPDRLRDPSGAASSMRRVYQQNGDFSISQELASFREDIVSSAKELRMQTPQTLTEDNTSLVRHLRGRKRRLLADTMKSLIHMGIRRNLGTTELSNQGDMSVILASSPDFVQNNSHVIRAAADSFHQILDIIPDARAMIREHSDDLTDGEVNRGLGLLEGVLSIAISQRIDIRKSTKSSKNLTDCLEALIRLQQIPPENIIHTPLRATEREDWLLKSSCWLIELLPLSCHILEFQAQHAGLDVLALLSSLQDSTNRLRRSNAQIRENAPLPVGLYDQSQLKALDDCTEELNHLNTILEDWQMREPRVGYLLRQIIPWTLPKVFELTDMNGAVKRNVDDIDSASRQVLDQCFVAMQRLANIQSAMPESTEESGWLVKTNKAFMDLTKVLHIDDIANNIEQILVQLHHLEKEHIPLALSVLTVAMPVLEQFQKIAQHVCDRQIIAHLETCRMGAMLTKSFVSLAKEGFCTPSEPSRGEEQSGKLESGTGLGEGEGAEDISKDVGEDEDLSELAQNGEKQDKDEGDMDKSKDAVDMGADDLEGEMGSEDEKASNEDDGDAETGSEDEDDMDEETGSVDELDPSAVDEKMWDDARNEAEKEEKEMKSEKTNGKKTDDQTAKDDDKKQEGEEEEGELNDEPEGEATDAEDETEGQGRPEAENLDPHLQEEEALDIPEDIQFDNVEGKEDDTSDDGMDDMSDIDNPEGVEPEQVDKLSDHDEEGDKAVDDQTEDEPADENDEQQEDGKATDDTVMEDQPEEEDKKQDGFQAREDDMQYDFEDNDGGETGAANQQQDQSNDEQNQAAQGQNDTEVTVEEQKTQTGQPSEQQQDGDAAQGAMERGAGRDNEQQQRRQDHALQKLADVLEQFHQRREILTASEERKQGELDQDVDMADADFEHVGEDEEQSDAQALGTAATEQAQKLDQSKAIEDRDADANQDLPMPEDQEVQESQLQQESIAERFSRLQAQPREQREGESGALLSQQDLAQRQPESFANVDTMEEDLEEPDSVEILNGHNMSSPPTSSSDAAALWAHCSTRTHALSLLLTEQLRLILAPTTATKLRGDFRTGKRLNIKRIIPYIASGYKRDKIWMRRSVPSKRNYQIMIAVDDSKSMSESGADLLAFETLAMLCKSLSMLEVGDLSVVSFGEEEHIRIAHAFGHPFTSAESGASIFQNFSFNQKGTDVRKLIHESISIFQDARLRSSNQASDDLWQLQLIVSDGHCSDHEGVRRLVRAAHESKIMIVFVIVDAGRDSIVDLKQAVFEREDPLDLKSELKVKTRRYLEGFPFQYYVVVRDVGDLPGVLARVLKGWFEGVVDVQ